MLRLGIQGLTLQGNCWIVIILGSEIRMENGRSELLGDVWMYMESDFGVVCCRSYRDQVPVLPGDGDPIHALG